MDIKTGKRFGLFTHFIAFLLPASKIPETLFEL